MDKVSRLVLTLAISLALALLVACQQTADAEAEVVPAETVAVEAMAGVLSWQTQYDLGMKYLSEGNYEEAVIAFTAAIELEPKKADAYLGMADVYIAQNNFDAAIAILEQGLAEMDDEALQARLDELNEGNVSDFWGNVRKVSTYDGSGLLIRYEEYEYIDGKKSMITCYDGDGIQIGQGNLLYDANGNTLQTYIYAPG